jgi:toxin HigB-1
MKGIFDVRLTRTALKDLKKVPLYVAIKLQAWIDNVGHHGLNETRKIPGYHDEPLKGKRVGQRSIRLSRAYRAIYTIEKDGTIKLIEIQEVNKHEY